MKEYHKIKTIFKRDMANKGRIIMGEYSCPEFEYLANNKWLFTEKVDGTNIRIEWQKGQGIKIGGRTDSAQIPVFLLDKINQLLPAELFEKVINKTESLCLYGEGYGAKIQKGGGNYNSNGVDFVLFDVFIDGWWLKREAVEEIANLLNIDIIPIKGKGTLYDAVVLTEAGFESNWGQFNAEGIVLKPIIELQNRAGNRIITKIKHKDFIHLKEN